MQVEGLQNPTVFADGKGQKAGAVVSMLPGGTHRGLFSRRSLLIASFLFLLVNWKQGY